MTEALNADLVKQLTEADVKLIELVAADLSDAQMATDLGLSKNAIEKRWAKLRKRFGVHSRGAIVARYFMERSRGIEELFEAHQKLHDELPIGFFAFDEHRRVAYCNRKAAQMLGLRPADLIGNDKIWKQVTPGAAQRERIRREFIDAIRDFPKHVTRIVRLDGSVVNVAWSSRARSHPILPYHWWVIGEDVTEKYDEARSSRGSFASLEAAMNGHAVVNGARSVVQPGA